MQLCLSRFHMVTVHIKCILRSYFIFTAIETSWGKYENPHSLMEVVLQLSYDSWIERAGIGITYTRVLVSGHICLDKCFWIGCIVVQWYVVAEKYSIFRTSYFVQKEKFVLLSVFSNVCQPSVLFRCVTLVVRRWSLTANRASLQCIFSQGECVRT